MALLTAHCNHTQKPVFYYFSVESGCTDLGLQHIHRLHGILVQQILLLQELSIFCAGRCRHLQQHLELAVWNGGWHHDCPISLAHECLEWFNVRVYENGSRLLASYWSKADYAEWSSQTTECQVQRPNELSGKFRTGASTSPPLSDLKSTYGKTGGSRILELGGGPTMKDSEKSQQKPMRRCWRHF